MLQHCFEHRLEMYACTRTCPCTHKQTNKQRERGVTSGLFNQRKMMCADETSLKRNWFDQHRCYTNHSPRWRESVVSNDSDNEYLITTTRWLSVKKVNQNRNEKVNFSRSSVHRERWFHLLGPVTSKVAFVFDLSPVLHIANTTKRTDLNFTDCFNSAEAHKYIPGLDHTMWIVNVDCCSTSIQWKCSLKHVSVIVFTGTCHQMFNTVLHVYAVSMNRKLQ